MFKVGDKIRSIVTECEILEVHPQVYEVKVYNHEAAPDGSIFMLNYKSAHRYYKLMPPDGNDILKGLCSK